jgi:hypothetical protein
VAKKAAKKTAKKTAKRAAKKTTKKVTANGPGAADICSRQPDRSVAVPPGKRFDFYIDVPDADVPALIRCHEGEFYDYNLIPSRTRKVTTVVLMYREGNG